MIKAKFLSFLFVSSMIFLFACKDSPKETTPDPNMNTEVTIPPVSPTPTTPEPAQNAAGVWHYICNNGCAGGAGVAGNCATCGNALVHNQAYHGPTDQTMQTRSPEPPQNAAGVWHYICANGCAGGAGTSGNCTTCGSPLAHNALYHQ